MTTPHAAADLTAYLLGELSATRRAEVEAHLTECAACRAELDEIRVAVDALAEVRVAPALSRRAEDAIVARVARSPSPTWTSGAVVRVAAVALIAIFSAALGFGLGRSAAGRDDARRIAQTPVADSSLRTFLLLLEEPTWPPPRPLARAGYSEWGVALRTQGRYVGAAKLTEEPGFRVDSGGRVTRPERSARPPNVSGWYLVRARDYDDAIAWVRRGPQLAYGSVLVRQVEGSSR